MPGKKGGGGGGGKGGPTTGDDYIVGTKRADTIDALAGDDTVIAGDGDDIVNGGPGDDTLYGGRGVDELNGGDDDDFLAGNVGNDELNGGDGHDIASYTGDPPTSSGPGGDVGYVIQAGGSTGDYTVTGGGYVDTLTGIEEIWGSNSNDTFNGGYWNEVFDGRLGDDVFTGNGGADTFIFGSGGGHDVITDFDASEGDKLDLSVSSYLSIGDIDTTGGGVVNAFDEHVTINDDGDMVIDLGAAAGFAPGENTLTLVDVTSLSVGDFIF